MRPDDKPAQDPLTPAINWIRERGGTRACAEDAIKLALSHDVTKVREALDKAGAPAGTFSLLGADLYHLGVR